MVLSRLGVLRGMAMAALSFFVRPVFAQQVLSNSPTSDVTIPESAQGLTGDKKLVFDTWVAFWRGDVERGLANMTDDVTWLVPGSMKTSGLKDGKDAVRKFRHNNLSLFSEIHTKVVGIYSDGNTVVMEMSSTAKLKNGQPYENAGITVWDMENGKIKRVREYVDTYKAAALNAMIADKTRTP
jgi:ketosteroid isomerase-like protein